MNNIDAGVDKQGSVSKFCVWIIPEISVIFLTNVPSHRGKNNFFHGWVSTAEPPALMDKNRFEKLKKQESNVIRSLLKKQNEMLGKSLSHLDHLIYLQKSISLMSLADISKVLADKLPYILFIRYFSLFLFDKSKKVLSLAHYFRIPLAKNQVLC